MAIRIINIKGGNGFPVTRDVDSNADHGSIPNSTYFTQVDLGGVIRYKDSSGNVQDAYTDPTVAANLANISPAAYTTVQQMHDVINSAGRITGNTISDNGDGTFDVQAGEGTLRATNDPLAELKFIEWAALTNQALGDGLTRYVGVEYNAGSPQLVVKTSDIWDYNTDFPLGTVVREGSVIHILESNHNIGNHVSLHNQRLYETAPLARDVRGGGLILSETGTRNIAISAGRMWSRLNVNNFAAFNTAVSGSFDAYYSDGASGFTKIAAETQINNTQYDNGSGVLQALGSSKYTVRWVYAEADGGVIVLFGSGQYSGVAQAELEEVPANLPARVSLLGLFVGRIVIQQGASTFSSLSTAFNTVFKPQAVTTHGELGGLQGGAASEYYHLTAAQHTALEVKAKVTFAHTAFTAAATSETINAFSLPAGAKLTSVTLKTTQAFAGTGITAWTCELGILSGDTAKYAEASDMFSAVSDTNFFHYGNNVVENWGSATQITITARSTGGNLSASTAGSVDVIYTYEPYKI
jgi:hypothetical protein